MSNIFANYRSGDIDPSSMKPSYKVSEIVDKKFTLMSMRKLTQSASQYSDDPTMLVNAVFTDTGEEFVFFAQQKVLYSKLDYLNDLLVDGDAQVRTADLMIVKQATKDGKATYYDLVDVSPQ